MHHSLVTKVPSLVLALGVALTGCAADELDQAVEAVRIASPCPSPMPSGAVAGTSLTPAADQRIAFALHAVGTQNYTCNATGTGWTFTGPQANLYVQDRGNDRGRGHGCDRDDDRVVGTHFASAAGPTRPEWQLRDGSAVIGQRAAGVTVATTAVPWLLLTAASHEGDGRMTDVTSIQRLSTVGGLAPTTPCTAGAEVRVPYEADYVFYTTHAERPERNLQCRSTP